MVGFSTRRLFVERRERTEAAMTMVWGLFIVSLISSMVLSLLTRACKWCRQLPGWEKPQGRERYKRRFLVRGLSPRDLPCLWCMKQSCPFHLVRWRPKVSRFIMACLRVFPDFEKSGIPLRPMNCLNRVYLWSPKIRISLRWLPGKWPILQTSVAGCGQNR